MKMQHVSKSKFKAGALEYMRMVENNKKPIIITHLGKPVIQIKPYEKSTTTDPYAFFKGSVLKYERPNDPVALEEWGALK